MFQIWNLFNYFPSLSKEYPLKKSTVKNEVFIPGNKYPLLQKGEIVKETQNMNMVTAIINNYEGKTRNKKIGYLGFFFFGYPRTNLFRGYPGMNLFFGYPGIHLRDTPPT